MICQSMNHHGNLMINLKDVVIFLFQRYFNFFFLVNIYPLYPVYFAGENTSLICTTNSNATEIKWILNYTLYLNSSVVDKRLGVGILNIRNISTNYNATTIRCQVHQCHSRTRYLLIQGMSRYCALNFQTQDIINFTDIDCVHD